jgi:hypothetical protein
MHAGGAQRHKKPCHDIALPSALRQSMTTLPLVPHSAPAPSPRPILKPPRRPTKSQHLPDGLEPPQRFLERVAVHFARNVLSGAGDIPGQVPLVLGIWGPKVRPPSNYLCCGCARLRARACVLVLDCAGHG